MQYKCIYCLLDWRNNFHIATYNMTDNLSNCSISCVDLMAIELVRERGVGVLLSSRRVVPHEVRVAVRLHTVKLQVQPLPVWSVVPPGVCQNPIEGHDVAESHLKGFILGQLFVLAPLGDHFA